MSKLGLYAVNSDKVFHMDGYPGSENVPDWRQTSLYLDGILNRKTINESNRLGIYRNGNKLMLNGETVSTSNLSSPAVKCSDGSISFGGFPVATAKIVNITKQDYIKLRSGRSVNGYQKYSSEVAYNIVSNVTDIDGGVFESEFKQEDIIVASFDGSLPENNITESTYTSAATPTLAMRDFEPIINKGEGLVLHYFVDTKYYDSVHLRSDNSSILPSVHLDNTFTVIVKDKFGNELYKATTYAGEFRCRTAPFMDGNTPFVGETWFSVQCIDNHGRGSVEHFFDVLVKDPAAEKPMYDVTAEDLAEYGITYNTGVNDFVAGYHNVLGLNNLMKDIAAGGVYGGIRLYNNGTPVTYFVDYHPVVGMTNSVPSFATTESYYLVYYDVDTGILEGVGSNGRFTLQSQTISAFADCQIRQGSSFKININGTDRVVPVEADELPEDWILNDKAHAFRNNEDKIIRMWGVEEKNSSSEVYDPKVYWPREALATKTLNLVLEAAVNGGSGLVDGQYKDNMKWLFPRTGYYYCVYKTPEGCRTDGTLDFSTNFINIPSHFTLDLNGNAIQITDSTDLTTFPAIIQVVGSKDAHVCNGKIVGASACNDSALQNDSDEEICRIHDRVFKLAVLRQSIKFPDTFVSNQSSSVPPSAWESAFMAVSGTWEGAPNIQQFGTMFCTVKNVESYAGCGYENTFSYGLDNARGISSSTYSYYNIPPRPITGMYTKSELKFSLLGYMNGTSVSETSAVDDVATPVDENGTPYSTGTGEVRLASTVDYLPLYDSGNNPILRTRVIMPGEDPVTLIEHTALIASGDTTQMRGGALPEVFVHFYRQVGSQYEHIKTIKTMYWLMIKTPEDATHIRMTGYCWYTNSQITKLDYVGITARRLCSSNTYMNVNTHHTKSVGLNGVGINLRFIDCLFSNIQDTPDNINITPMLMDIEENRRVAYLISLIRCVCHGGVTDNGRTNHQSVIAAAGRSLCMRNCYGVGFSGQLFDSYIVDSRLSILRIAALARSANNHQGIIKNCTVSGMGQQIPFAYYDKRRPVSSNAAVEEVTQYVTLSDCMLFTPTKDPNLRGVSTALADLLKILNQDYAVVSGRSTITIHDKTGEAQQQIINEINE